MVKVTILIIFHKYNWRPPLGLSKTNVGNTDILFTITSIIRLKIVTRGAAITTHIIDNGDQETLVEMQYVMDELFFSNQTLRKISWPSKSETMKISW